MCLHLKCFQLLMMETVGSNYVVCTVAVINWHFRSMWLACQKKSYLICDKITNFPIFTQPISYHKMLNRNTIKTSPPVNGILYRILYRIHTNKIILIQTILHNFLFSFFRKRNKIAFYQFISIQNKSNLNYLNIAFLFIISELLLNR